MWRAPLIYRCVPLFRKVINIEGRAFAELAVKSAYSTHFSSFVNASSFVPNSGSYAGTSRCFHTCSYLCKVIEVEGPAFAESISEGDVKWIKQKGDVVNADDVVAEIETDKTSVEVPAPYSGTIVELLVEDGGRVVAHQKLFKLDLDKVEGAEASTEAEKKEPDSAPVTSPVQDSEVKSAVPPTPVTEKVTLPPPQPPVQSKSPPKPTIKSDASMDQKPITGSRGETRVKMNRMRLRIAQRLKDAQNTYAMLTTFNEVDMSNVIEMRSRYQKDFVKKHGIKLGFMSPFIRASTYALQEFPTVNAVIDENEIVYHDYIDISVAVATPKGLVVPVLRNVEKMDYSAIEKALVELGVKARDGKLAIEEMEGGTFTVSNGGVFGSMFGTPIVNPPQAAILGMHAVFDRPVAIDGKVEVRPIMTIALTYDHRLVDGQEAVSFLKKIKNAVEDPRIILMNL